MWGGTDKGSITGLKRLAALAACLTGLVLAPAALAHVERSSYWPDPGVDMADGVPTGGAVPEARDLFTALNQGPPGETRVVCDGGQSLPYRAGQQVNGRLDLQVSRDRVNRLERKLKKLRRKLKKANENSDKKKKANRLKDRLTQAKLDYRAALAAEDLARQGGQQAYQRALAAELAARQNYQQTLGAAPSIQRLDAMIADARANGYEIRPSEPPVPFSAQEADRLRDFNARLLAACDYEEIQPAVNDSGNNDRVVIMPGIYTEPTARAVPTSPPPASDPCEGMEETNDTGNTGALSYRYQFHCPNDQNLIAVMGREPAKDGTGAEVPPPPPEADDPRRDGIPDEGPCIRCNLQMEGSGVSADDVVVDSGRVESGNGPPADSVKDVGIRADRADGFVLRNMTVRHSREHDIYSPETDGMLLERFKNYFNGHYGVLTFVAQHHLIQDCDTAGSGDAAIYPGSSAEAGEQTDPDVDVDDPMLEHSISGEYSTEIRRCDMRHSNTGYSGTAGNSVWMHDNDFYDNAMGFVTDVFTASGHPGFPQDSDLIEDNEFYSNNFNPYLEECDYGAGETPGPNGPDQDCSDVVPRIPAPVGTAIFIPGGNNNTFRNNRIWDNWRRGMMLFSVPDTFVCGSNPTAGGNEQHGCDETEVNTSHRNEFHDNVMGRAPDGTVLPNGDGNVAEGRTDFWWDSFTGNVRNCWYDNVGPNNDRASLTATPPMNPLGDDAPQGTFLPGRGPTGDCATSAGNGIPPAQEAELLNCLIDMEAGTGTCNWSTTPPKP